MYVATSTDRRLAEAALRCAGIDGYFRGLITCADVGAQKEDSPAIYEGAMRRLQSSKRDTVVFEDSLAAIRTAKAAGFRVAGVYNPAAEAEPLSHPGEALPPPFLRGDGHHRHGLTLADREDPERAPFSFKFLPPSVTNYPPCRGFHGRRERRDARGNPWRKFPAPKSDGLWQVSSLPSNPATARRS